MDSKRAIATTDTTSSSSSLHTNTGISYSRGGSSGGGKGARQHQSRGKEDSDEQQRRRDNSEKKKKETKSVSGGSSGSSSKQKSQNSTSPLQNSPQSSTNQFSSRYYYREVPPRFQLQKHPPSKQSQPTQSQYTSSKQSKPNQSTKKPKETGSRWQHNPDTSNHWSMDADNSSSSGTISRAPGGSSSSYEAGVRRSAHADKDPTSYHHLGKSGWGGGGDDSVIWGSQHSNDHKMVTEQWTLSDENSPTEQNRAELSGEHLSGSENGRHAPLEWDEDLSEGSDRDTFTAGPPSRSKTFPRDMARMGEDKSILSRHCSESEASRDYASSTHSLRDAVDSRAGIDGDGGGWRMQHSRGSIGSTSSVNSVGSNSSWRNTRAGSNGSGGGGSYPRSTSPRKNSSNFTAGKSSGRFFAKGKKPSLDLHAADSLNDAPNGWGELPSPHNTNMDTGTEVWGIPEDVKKRMSQGGNVGGWGDRMPPAHNRWGDGWNQNGNDGSQNPSWGSSDTGAAAAANRGQKKEIVSHENIKKLVDMGFNHEHCEKALKINHNNLEDALGDLLTINSLPQDDPMATFGSSPLIARKHPNTLNGAHFKQTYSPSLSGSTASTPHAIPGLNDQQPVTHQLSMSGQVTPGVQPQINHMAHHQSKHLQQDISQKLARLQHMKQSITMQLKSSQPHQANQQQLLSLQLNQVNANISSLNQQLLLVSQSSQQPQYKGASRNGGKPADFKSVNGMQNSTSGYNGHSDQLGYQSPQGGPEINGLSYNMHKMSVGSSQPSYSQQSAQSMSRLQQIISGPVDSVDRDGNRGLDELSRQSYHSSMMQPTSEQPPCFSRSTSSDPSITTAASSSSSFAGKGNMVDDIPEFKPGVPWQPRSQTKEPSFSNSLGYNPTSSSYLPSSDSKYAASSENDGYYQTSHDSSSYRPSFTAGNHQMGGASYDSQQQQYGPGYSTNRGVHRDRISAQRGGRNGRGNYSHNGQSSGGQFGMLQSPQQRGHYVGRGQQSPHSSQSQYTSLGTAVNGYSAPPQGFNQPRIPRGFDSPSSSAKKWNSESSNPWSNKPFSGGSIWGQNSFSPAPPSDGYLSQELPYSEWRTAGTPTQQPASTPASLHSGSEGLSSWLIIKNVSQIDETSLREVCSEYGQVTDCSIKSSSDSAVVCYSSTEEAAVAIAGLQKSPVICGVAVKPRFASEADLSAFFVNPKTSSSKSLSWLPEPATSSSSFSPSSSQPTPLSLSSSTWGPPAVGGFSSASMSGSSVESPSSVWGTGGSDEGGLLTGMVSNPWSTSQRSRQDVLQQEEATNYSTSPSVLSTLLPNDLF